MSKWACSKGSGARSHTERQEWSDRGHDDGQYVPWHRDGNWLSDPADQDWDGTDGLTAVLGGVAMAAGNATTSIGLLETVLSDTGLYSVATGKAVFEASAWSAEPGGAAAVADVFLEVAGADFVFQREFDGAASGANEAWAYAAIEYIAVDFHGWSPRHGPIAFQFGASLEVEPYRFETPLAGLAGALATVGAAAETYGSDTLSATFTDALVVENQFSFVQALGLVAV